MTLPANSPPATVYDNLLKTEEQTSIWAYLNRPGWSFGGYSAAGGDRYLYKHFAGFVADGQEPRTAQAIEDELMNNAPIIGQLWHALKTGPLKGNALARCYANAMTGGVEGGLHLDSNIPTHLTSIYYPHPVWEPNFGGETLLFNDAGDEILAAIYPRPNRLVVFAGTIPHVARPMSRRRPDLRITLMFKTMPA
jgi:2-oxoglutarate-Fe(II)-dependent oxygenase superfamily protein